MESTKVCPHCGYKVQLLVRICPECGQPFHANHIRAFALVEGTAGVGKSTLITQMVQTYIREQAALRTLLHLSQDHTYGPLDPDNINNLITAEENWAYLERVYGTLSFLSSPTGTPATLACIVETLHLTLALRPGLLTRKQILDYDERLAELGCKLVFIHISSQAHWQRCIWERRNNGFITKYGVKYGRDLTEIHNYYMREQDQMLELFEHSQMNKLLLDGELPSETMLETAYRFWSS